VAADSPPSASPDPDPSRQEPLLDNMDESVVSEAKRVANDADDRDEMRIVREDLGELAP
jgi:hypothetical protein